MKPVSFSATGKPAPPAGSPLLPDAAPLGRHAPYGTPISPRDSSGYGNPTAVFRGSGKRATAITTKAATPEKEMMLTGAQLTSGQEYKIGCFVTVSSF